MKVLYVVHANIWNEYSGTPLIAEQYAKESINKGCEACIITPTFDNFDFQNQKLKKINNISYLNWPGLKNWNIDAFDGIKSNKNQLFKIPFNQLFSAIPQLPHFSQDVGLSSCNHGFHLKNTS